MKLSVEENVAAAFPQLKLGVALFRGLDNTGQSEELARAQAELAAKSASYWSKGTLNEAPAITSWQEAYRLFGVNPKKQRPTLEAMMLRLIKDKPFPRISKIVDAYLLTQTEHLLPIGGHDLATVGDSIYLRTSPGNETFQPLGAESEEMTNPDEIVYADETRVLTRSWNWRDCDPCKITNATTDAVLVMESVQPDKPVEEVEAAVADLCKRVTKYCGGQARGAVLAVSHSRIVDI